MFAHLVVIGCSWGGLRALRMILRDLPGDFAAPVIVVQHRGAGSTDAGLARGLSPHTPLPVQTVEDKHAIVPGTVFVAPPDYHLLVDNGSFALSTDERVQHSRPSIDVLFDTAAFAYGADVVGVLLTGANVDGAAGLRVIRDRGGHTLVQDPTEAERDTMPRAAIAAGAAEEILPLSRIGGALVRHCAVGASAACTFGVTR